MTKIEIDGVKYHSKTEAEKAGVFSLKDHKREYAKNYMNKLYKDDKTYRESHKEKVLARYHRTKKLKKKKNLETVENVENQNILEFFEKL